MADVDGQLVLQEVARELLGSRPASLVGSLPPPPTPEPVAEDAVVTLLAPLSGQVEVQTEVRFTVEAPAQRELVVVFVWVAYPEDGGTEVIWTGDGFAPRYSTSTRLPLANGFDFTIKRVGGWQSAPQFAIKAFTEGVV
jgi:hypothetical protein